MARTWLSLTVELLGGRGKEFWPAPGRVFAVGPSHTFRDLAHAINTAFTRWDHAHLSMFTLDDGRVITDPATGAELANAMAGPMVEWMDIDKAKVSRTLQLGSEFCFTFDLGDGWTHRCVVAAEKVDPLEVLGIRSTAPLPYWGWGDIPDQYGRRWAEDDGESAPPAKPSQPHPMLTHEWPGRERTPALNLREVRTAIATEDPARFLAALTGRDIDNALQQVAAGIPLALDRLRPQAEPVTASLINRLRWRAGPGDEELATALLAHLRQEEPLGRALPVDLEMLSEVIEGELEETSGGFLDLHTGDAFDELFTDLSYVGEEAFVDVDTEPDRWLWVARAGTHKAWQDMAAFAERQQDPRLRERLEQAIEGKGAFHRFRSLVESEGLVDEWVAYSTDRRLGRARAFLAENDIRVV